MLVCAAATLIGGAASAADDGSESGLEERPELSLRVPAEQEAALIVAVEAATARCMAAHGFEYRFLDHAAFVAGIRYRNQVIEAQGFPLGDLATAGLDEPVNPSDPNQGNLTGLDEAAREAYDEALTGTDEVSVELEGMTLGMPYGGCRSAAYEDVYGGDYVEIQVGETLVGNLTSIVHWRVRADQRVLDAQAAWATCMSGHGFAYAGFDDAAAARAAAVQDEAATIAGADRACAADSRLITVYREVFDEQLAVVREQYREQLDRYLALRDQAIRGL